VTDKAGEAIGSELAWLGFWLMLGLANFGEDKITYLTNPDVVEKTISNLIQDEIFNSEEEKGE